MFGPLKPTSLSASTAHEAAALENLLSGAAFRGVGWVFLSRAAAELRRLVRLVILARLLSPQDFGLMGIALFVLGCLEVFTETGFNTALIRKQEEIRPYLNTVFTVQAIRGLLIGFLLALLAPWMAGFFESPQATLVIQVLALLVLLRELTNPATVYFTRELDFKKVFFWSLSETLTTLVIAVSLAVIYGNVWALAISVVAGQAVKTVVWVW